MSTRPASKGDAGRMDNVLSTEKREQVIAVARLGWPLRQIYSSVHGADVDRGWS